MSKFFYSDHFKVDLPEKHRFPMAKYGMLRQKLLENSILSESQLIAAKVAQADLAKRAHDQTYVDDVINLTLDQRKARRIGLPLTRQMVNRTLVSLDASFQAAQMALKYGVSGALSSGTHHAGYSHGEGFCFFNDFAVIARTYPKYKILIIDLDVHQGNGNGEILKTDSNVDIIDMYCEQNYPFRKSLSGLSIPLKSQMEDDEYLVNLEKALEQIQFSYDLILYQAGVDIYKEDHLGLLNITKNGIKTRDKMVFEFAKENGAAISFVIGGGYCKDISETVDCNYNTFVTAKSIFNF